MNRVRATRYVTPLREGGSLPGIVEADDLGTYVCKFRGAGQGLLVLVAEVVVGELARRLDLRTPRLVELEVEPAMARYEADQEVQDLLNASIGLNLGVDFLPGSFGFDPTFEVAPDIAARTLWLDALVANVDRSWRNPNLLVWHGDLWLIDHGAALYFHHAWSGGITDPARFAAQPYDVGDHVLGRHAAARRRAGRRARGTGRRRHARRGAGAGARRVAGAATGSRVARRAACRLPDLPACTPRRLPRLGAGRAAA